MMGGSVTKHVCACAGLSVCVQVCRCAGVLRTHTCMHSTIVPTWMYPSTAAASWRCSAGNRPRSGGAAASAILSSSSCTSSWERDGEERAAEAAVSLRSSSRPLGRG